MPTWKTIDDGDWSTQEPNQATKNAGIENNLKKGDDSLVYENELKLAILNSLSVENRPSREKQSKIEFDNNDGGKMKCRMPTGMTQEPSSENRQPVGVNRITKKRKAEDENKKMAASMESFLKKPPSSSNVEKEQGLVATRNEVTPVHSCRPTVELLDDSEDEKPVENNCTDAEQTSNVGSEGMNEHTGNTFYGFEGLLKVCVIRNTPAGSEVWLNPEAIREFITHFEAP
jgi:hypothetical protein